MSNYILENASEFERLEKQSQNKFYDFESELRDFHPKANGVILDAGCGSGVVSRYLVRKFPESQVVGCDFSDIRVKQAGRFSGHIQNLTFQREDLMQLSFEEGTFDHVILRYVAQHQSHSDLKHIFSEIHRVLKVGGSIHVVDADGFLFNLFPVDPAVESMMMKIRNSQKVDFEIGRKLPDFLACAGFGDLDWKVEVCSFQGDELPGEQQRMIERFNLANPFFLELLKDQQAVDLFCESYLRAMVQPGAVMFFNKFVVSGFKKS